MTIPQFLPETFVSFDIETTGPVPGLYSMLSLGAVAARVSEGGEEFEVLGSFSVNLEALPGAGFDAKTYEWWQGQPKAWTAATAGALPPEVAMHRWDRWVHEVAGGKVPVYLAYPLGFDYPFLTYYTERYLHRSEHWAGLDIKSYCAAVLGGSWKKISKRFIPPEWWVEKTTGHSHVAVEDALEQFYLFVGAKRAAKGMRAI